MITQILGALILAFLFCAAFGRRFVGWLGKKGFWQPLNDDVEKKIYAEDNDNDGKSS